MTLRGPWVALALVVLSLLLVSSIPPAAASRAPGTISGARPVEGMQEGAHHLAMRSGGRMPTAAPTYQVEFDETGLTAGIAWYVNLTEPGGGVLHNTSLTSAVIFAVPNGTYSYLIESPVPVPPTIPVLGLSGEQFVATDQTLGQVTVTGQPTTPILMTYQAQYLLFMTPNPTAGGTDSPGITYEDVGSTVLISAAPNPGYVFTGWSGTCFLTVLPYICAGGYRGYTGTAPQATVTMNGTVVELANFAVKDYAVTFQGLGLPANVAWNVTLNGTTHSGPGSLLFSMANGTYNYSVGVPVHGPDGVRFTTLNISGSVTVQGANVSVEIPFTTQYYLHVSVSAQGEGTITPSSQWYDNGTQVTLEATPSTGFAFTEWNGSGGRVTGEANSTLHLTMSHAITEVASFGRLYPVSLLESGLPLHTAWSVSSGGSTFSANATEIAFDLTNGTYGYTLGLVPGYHPTAVRGDFSVSGGAASVNVTFHIVTYGVAFIGKGGGGGSWSIVMGTVETMSGPDGTVTLVLPNGTYSWRLLAPSGYRGTQTSGVLVIHGENETENLTFHPLPPNGLLGVGESASYAILGALLASAILVVGIWLIALSASSRHSHGSPLPDDAGENGAGIPPEGTEEKGSSKVSNTPEPANEKGKDLATGETEAAGSPAEATVPKDAPAKATRESPKGTPAEAPEDSQAEAHEDPPTNAPAETPQDRPAEAPTDSPSDTLIATRPKSRGMKSPTKGNTVRDPPA